METQGCYLLKETVADVNKWSLSPNQTAALLNAPGKILASFLSVISQIKRPNLLQFFFLHSPKLRILVGTQVGTNPDYAATCHCHGTSIDEGLVCTRCFAGIHLSKEKTFTVHCMKFGSAKCAICCSQDGAQQQQ